QPKARTDEALAFVCVVVSCSLLLEYSFFTKDVRYVAVLDVPIRILAVMFLADLLAIDAARWRAAAATVIVAFMCWADYTTFRLMFVSMKIYDPMTYWLVIAR